MPPTDDRLSLSDPTAGPAFHRLLGGRMINDHKLTLHCPAHDDRHPSLDLLFEGDKWLVNCRAGCSQKAILDALPLANSRGPSTASMAAARGAPVSRYLYCRTDGSLIGTKERFEGLEDGQRHKWCLWRAPDGSTGLKGEKALLYRTELLPRAPKEIPIDVVEGEKCVLAMEGLGLTAVCSPNGAEGPWRSEFSELLAGRSVRLWSDNDEPGRRHMMAVATALHASTTEVTMIELPDLPEKGDVVDYLAAGHDREDLEAIIAAAQPLHPAWQYEAPVLAARQFPELRWAIPGILPEGVAILAGKPKMGKSWLALDVCLAVASGGKALSTIETDRGDVLYLALEDTARRLQSRLKILIGDGAAPAGLAFWTRCPTLDAGGREVIDEWLATHPEARLVVIDTLKRVRPQPTGSSIYNDDYEALMPLADLAHRRHVAILVIHHLRKAAAPDPLDELSGSTGLTGSADGLLVLRRKRGEGTAELTVVHREAGEQELALRFDAESARWSILGDVAEVRMSDERRAILDLLAESPGLTPKEIAETLDRSRGSIRALLCRLASEGAVISEKSRYRLPSKQHTASAPLLQASE